MMKRDVIVVGASAGGVEAITKFISCLSKDFQGCVFVVLHIPPHSSSSLPIILSNCNVFEAVHPKDGEEIKPRKIYVAPPDHHLLIEKNTVLVKKGPKENRFRPSIDALFRSAAYTFAENVTGIILSGVLDDGTSGMWSIKRLGGTTMVQLPSEAKHAEMPQNVMEFVKVDYCVGIEEMCNIIMARELDVATKKRAYIKDEIERLELEVTISKQDIYANVSIVSKGVPTSFTCPACHSILIKLVEDKIVRFRCYAGHAFTASALITGFAQNIEGLLSKSLQAMEECTSLLENLKDEYSTLGHSKASQFFDKAEEANRNRTRLIIESIAAPRLGLDVPPLEVFKDSRQEIPKSSSKLKGKKG